MGARGPRGNAANRGRPGSKSTTAGTDSDEEADKNTCDGSEYRIVGDCIVSSSSSSLFGVDDDENSDYAKFEKKNQMFEYASMEKQMLFD